MAAQETRGTVLIALSMNLAIAVAKFVAGVLSGSSAMLAEGAHSVADTMNQVFLLASLKLSGRPPDEEHPFGYGKERYFWTFLAAVGIFVAGGLFSILEGVERLTSPGGEEGGVIVAYAVLAVAFVLEGVSWTRAVRQVHGEARKAGFGFMRFIVKRADPTVKTVVYEDTAALAGLVIAALGITLHLVTGNPVYDAAASIVIGLELISFAFVLGRDSKALLVGQAVPPELQRGIRAEIAGVDGIVDVLDLLTMQLGPESVLVAARIDLSNSLTGDDAERAAEHADRRLRERFPEVRHVFLDPTRRPHRPDTRSEPIR
ncbi:MAG: cation diffusion facilitator family transporter [Streptosporangiaceae bacterium]